jgi:hypothetical protein
VREQEARARKREERQQDRLDRLESMVCTQHEKLDRLENLVYRIMHRDRVEGELEAPRRGQRQRAQGGQASPLERSETENTLPVHQHERDDAETESDSGSSLYKPRHTARVYPFQST